MRSRLTLQVYLDERFTGGTTRFYSARHGALLGAVVPKTGRAVVFDHALWHDGEPVTAGTKHVMRTDVMYEDVAPEVAPASPDVLRGHEGYVFSVIPLSDGSLVSGSRDRTIRRWVPSTSAWRNTHVLTGHEASVLALAELSPSVVASASRDRTVRAFDLATGANRVLATLGGAVLALTRLTDGLLAAAAADGVITLIDPDGAPVRELIGHRGWVWALARTDDRRLVSGSDDGTVRLWDPHSGECLGAASPGRGACHAAVALEGGRVACGFADGHIVVYSVEAGTLSPVAVFAAHQGEVYALEALGDGSLATGGEDSMARVFRVADGHVVSAFPLGGFARSICPVPRSGQLAVASYDGTIRLVPVTEQESPAYPPRAAWAARAHSDPASSPAAALRHP